LDALIEAGGQKPKALCFAARTDKGVHALKNVATCWFPEGFEDAPFLERLHAMDVPGLRGIQAERVHEKFHARGNADAKRYSYELNGLDPETSWQIIPELNLDAMREALSCIVGTHDFQSFRAKGCTAGTTLKTIYEATVRHCEQSEAIHIEFVGNSFLRQMIRILVGTLAEIGTGLRPPGAMKEILEAEDRRAAGITAPPQGLTLVEVLIKNQLRSGIVA
jgi:tRNA pseudouridine38-40 synthase